VEIGLKTNSLKPVSKNGGANQLHPTKAQDMLEHWDFKTANGNRVEVKSAKQKKRGQGTDLSIIFIELIGISGHQGWVYGEADQVAFELNKEFILVKRTDLIKLVEEKVTDEWADEPTLYKLYKRFDRPKEKVTVLNVEDVLTLKHIKLPL